MIDDQQRAMELLAQEYERDGITHVPDCIRREAMLTEMEHRAIRAITAALRAAPEVAPPFAEIYCGRGEFAYCDWEDFETVKGFSWSLTNNRGGITAYAKTWSSTDKVSRKRLTMHRMIINPPSGMFVDHIDGNGLNNRRSNLRVVTKQQNSFNQSSYRGKSRFKGVTFESTSNMWRATICIDGVKKSLGRHAVEEDAAIAYDLAAVKFFGEYAKLNFPLSIELHGASDG